MRIIIHNNDLVLPKHRALLAVDSEHETIETPEHVRHNRYFQQAGVTVWGRLGQPVRLFPFEYSVVAP